MKKSYHKNGVTVSEFDNKHSFDFKKGSAGKHRGEYPSSPAVAVAAGAPKKHANGRNQKRKSRLAAILAKKKA